MVFFYWMMPKEAAVIHCFSSWLNKCMFVCLVLHLCLLSVAVCVVDVLFWSLLVLVCLSLVNEA